VTLARGMREADAVVGENAEDDAARPARAHGHDREADPVLSAAEQSRERRRTTGSYFTRRAWRMAVLSLFLFWPLGFCAIALLARINPERMLLGRADRLRFFGGWVFGVLTVFLCVWFVAALMFGSATVFCEALSGLFQSHAV